MGITRRGHGRAYQSHKPLLLLSGHSWPLLTRFEVTCSEKLPHALSPAVPPTSPCLHPDFLPRCNVIRIKSYVIHFPVCLFSVSPPECESHKIGDLCLLRSLLMPQGLAQGRACSMGSINNCGNNE